MNRLQKISLSIDMKITGNHFIKKKISERPMITKNVKNEHCITFTKIPLKTVSLSYRSTKLILCVLSHTCRVFAFCIPKRYKRLQRFVAYVLK